MLRDSHAAASAARLRYESPERCGILRHRAGKGFTYRDAGGRLVRNAEVLARIRRLAIPPAWRDVCIARSPNAHLQATGYDVKGRKQYRYHPSWRLVRDVAKFDDIILFVQALPRLRRRLARDLREKALTKNKVVAVVVALMERTQLRVGNRKYTDQNGSFGLTTLRDQHARISGEELELRFRAKGGKLLDVRVRDRQLAQAVKRCRDIPGQTLFQYYDERGVRHAVTSTDVNAYLREAMGHAFTAKEFRTWAATSLAAQHLIKCVPCESATAGKRTLVRVAELVSQELGNTPSICRKCYIHPGIFDSYLRGELHTSFNTLLQRARRRRPPGLSINEAAVIALIETLIAAGEELALSA
ncbi:MAG: DNA topoisomerase IB [Myxococcota bacterium]